MVYVTGRTQLIHLVVEGEEEQAWSPQTFQRALRGGVSQTTDHHTITWLQVHPEGTPG